MKQLYQIPMQDVVVEKLVTEFAPIAGSAARSLAGAALLLSIVGARTQGLTKLQ
jgi:hypothetical protein